MSTATSSMAAAIDYLVDAATAAFPGALVLDGPMITEDQQEYQQRVTIGWDGDDEAFTPAAEGDQEFNALNLGTTKRETYSIVCSVTHWDGNGNTRTARSAAFALLRSFELLLRGANGVGSGDVTLGGAVLFAGVGGGIQLLQANTGAGMAVTIMFHVVCTARLTGS